jgi:hypothetical protein
MNGLRCVARGDVVYALLSRRGAAKAPGFFTPPETELQVGIVDYAAGYLAKPHAHRPPTASIDRVCEVLFVENGKIEVQIFDEAWGVLAVDVLSQGDCVVFIRGGHSVRMLEPTRLVEVKQGPYPGDGLAKSFLATP